MKFLTAKGYISLLKAEFDHLPRMAGTFRRIGVGEHLSTLEIIDRDLTAIAVKARHGTNAHIDIDWATFLAVETSSYCYAVGAAHPVWRRWAALAGFGHLMQSAFCTGVPYLVLAGEWECLAALRAVAPVKYLPTEAIVWQLAVEPHSIPVPPATDDVDSAWCRLLAAVPSGAQAEIDHSIQEIAQFWIMESEGDWEFFHPRSTPDFDPELSAVAVLARRNGWTPHALPSDVVRYVEPGLAAGWPEPLFPAISPLHRTS